MGDFNITYNSVKISSNSNISKLDNINLTKLEPEAFLKVSRIINFELDFDKIYELSIRSKQMYIVRL